MPQTQHVEPNPISFQGDDVMQNDAQSKVIKIESKSLTLQQCFTQNLYEIPDFQRPYSWGAQQLEDFWGDVIMAQGDLFFGSTVTWVSDTDELFRSTYSLIDGQQRLTTATIALSVIRDLLAEASEQSQKEDERKEACQQKDATQEYLVAENKAEARIHPVISRPEKNFYPLIQNPEGVSAAGEWDERTNAIKEAQKFFINRFSDTLENLYAVDRIKALRTWRNNIVRARVIQVELVSEEDGFLVFETLNTRGMELRLTDLVKNRLIRLISRDPADRETVTDRWEAIVQSVVGSEDGQSLDRFIWQSWNSRRKSVKEADLYKAIVRRLNNDPNEHRRYLDELEEDSRIFGRLNSEDVVKDKEKSNEGRNPFAVGEFVDSVRALAVFGIDVSNSAVLAVAREYVKDDKVTRKHLIDVVESIEKFHFQFSALASSGSSGGTRERYNALAVKITGASSKGEVTEAVNEFRAKLVRSLPDSSRTKKLFRELFYAPNVTLKRGDKQKAKKSFIAYVLAEFSKNSGAMPRGIDPNVWSIEHLRPQTQARSQTSNDPAFSIGNLMLLDTSLNGHLQDGQWNAKFGELSRRGIPLDDELQQWAIDKPETPTDKDIRDRAEYLANRAIDEIWAIR